MFAFSRSSRSLCGLLRRVRRPVLRLVLTASLVQGVALTAPVPASAAFSDGFIFGPQVIAELSALVAQLAAVKGAVNQVRDQARTAFNGKLFPPPGNLEAIGCFLARANAPPGLPPFLAALPCGTGSDPNYYRTAGGPVFDPPPFNQPLESCAANPGLAAPLCYEDEVASADLLAVGTAVAAMFVDTYATAYGGITRPPHVVDRHQRQQDVLTRLSALAPLVTGQFEDRLARERSVVANAMLVVEEWRGCQPFTAVVPLDAGDARLPCVTNGGMGSGSDGTVGMMQELGAQLELVHANQDGDPSQNQSSAMLLQVNMARARLQAALIEMTAAAQEDQQAAFLRAEASRRRSEQLLIERFDCVGGRGGVPAHSFNTFVPDFAAPAGGVCIGNP